jgi:hypothetical protein
MASELICCKIGCGKKADYEIHDGTPEYTHACLEHIPDLMTEAKQHNIFTLTESDVH